MTRMKAQLIVILGLFTALSACNSPSFNYGRSATPLQAQPISPVTSEALSPPPGMLVPDTGTEGDGSIDVAALEAPESAVTVTPGDLAGGWKLTAEGETCSLFTSQTTWTGGYRASTRGCQSPTLSTISAWNVNGAQLQLFDGEGQLLATLFGASKTEYSGQMRNGQAISFSR